MVDVYFYIIFLGFGLVKSKGPSLLLILLLADSDGKGSSKFEADVDYCEGRSFTPTTAVCWRLIIKEVEMQCCLDNIV